MICQQWNIAAAFAQGGQLDFDNRQSIIQVLPKRPVLDHLQQICVGRCYQPDIQADLFVISQAGYLSIFQHAEQFNLRLHRHLADLVQKQGASVGVFELTDSFAHGSGKCPLLMPKQFAFQNTVRQRRDIQGHKRLTFAFAVLMNRAGDQFFPVPLSPSIKTVLLVEATFFSLSTI